MALGPPPPAPDAFPSCAGSWHPAADRGWAGAQSRTIPPKTSAAAPRPYRLGVILKHLPGLLLAAVLLHALPLQVPLLGLLEDLVGSALPLPQELGSLRGAQQHGWAAESRDGVGRPGPGEERERSGRKDRQR